MLKKTTVFFLLLVVTSKIISSQPPAKAPKTEIKGGGAPKGTFTADLDCSVKLNASPKIIQLKADTPVIVALKAGDNSVEATSIDKKSNFKSSVKGVVGETTRVEISFFDNKRFLEYVKQGNLSMIESAVKKDPLLISNETATLISSPLEIAIINSQPEVVNFFLEKGVSFSKPKNIYPLHKAIMFASSAKITKTKKRIPPTDSILADLFLSKGCDINEKDEAGNTPLHAAVQYGKSDLVIFLIQRGASINTKNAFNDTPLKLAENKGYITIIDYLKSKDAVEK